MSKNSWTKEELEIIDEADNAFKKYWEGRSLGEDGNQYFDLIDKIKNQKLLTKEEFNTIQLINKNENDYTLISKKLAKLVINNYYKFSKYGNMNTSSWKLKDEVNF